MERNGTVYKDTQSDSKILAKDEGALLDLRRVANRLVSKQEEKCLGSLDSLLLMSLGQHVEKGKHVVTVK